MTKAIIESVPGVDYFNLNGISRPRAYEAIGVNLLSKKKGVKLISISRNENTIQDTIAFDEYLIDGVVPASQDECISLLNGIVFKKGGGNGVGVASSSVIPRNSMLVFKKKLPADIDYEEGQQIGDYCIGFVYDENGELEFINADYLGGDITLKGSYDIEIIINQQSK